jgi:hypothetical protein
MNPTIGNPFGSKRCGRPSRARLRHPAPSRALARGGARALRHRPAGRNDPRSVARRPLPTTTAHRSWPSPPPGTSGSAEVRLSHPLLSDPQPSGGSFFGLQLGASSSAKGRSGKSWKKGKAYSQTLRQGEVAAARARRKRARALALSQSCRFVNKPGLRALRPL